MALPIADRPPPSQSPVDPGHNDDLAQRRAGAAVQHQRVTAEAEAIARAAEQARRLAAATPVYGSPHRYPDAVRARVNWSRTD